MKLTKQIVIEALRKEPLTSGVWVTRPGTEQATPCKVCAVGAVLRQAGLNDVQIDACGGDLRGVSNDCGSQGDMETAEEKCRVLIGQGRYLTALSMYYETLVQETEWSDFDEFREPVVDWVTANFPDTFETEV